MLVFSKPLTAMMQVCTLPPTLVWRGRVRAQASKPQVIRLTTTSTSGFESLFPSLSHSANIYHLADEPVATGIIHIPHSIPNLICIYSTQITY